MVAVESVDVQKLGWVVDTRLHASRGEMANAMQSTIDSPWRWNDRPGTLDQGVGRETENEREESLIAFVSAVE